MEGKVYVVTGTHEAFNEYYDLYGEDAPLWETHYDFLGVFDSYDKAKLAKERYEERDRKEGVLVDGIFHESHLFEAEINECVINEKTSKQIQPSWKD